jgi:hypothetical protein
VSTEPCGARKNARLRLREIASNRAPRAHFLQNGISRKPFRGIDCQMTRQLRGTNKFPRKDGLIAEGHTRAATSIWFTSARRFSLAFYPILSGN